MTAKIKKPAKSHELQYRHKPRGVSKYNFDKVHWPYLPLIAILIALLIPTLQSGAISSNIRSPHVKVLNYATSMSAGGLLASTNTARANNQAPALSINSQLTSAAQAKANDMATRNYWSHNTPEGNPPWIFVTAQGYAYQKLGENLATGFSDEQATVDGWMASPPHKENMLNPDYSEVGFGFANNSDYTAAGGGPMTIIVAFYGKPLNPIVPPVAPIAAQPKPSPPSPAPSPQPPSTSSPTPSESSSQPSAADQTSPVRKSNPEPVTTEATSNQVSKPVKATPANLIFSGSPVSAYATTITTFLALAAIGLWISKHTLAVSKALLKGKRFAYKHPLFDAGLVIIVLLAVLLSRTVGFVL
jgi:uncharacterized protein YkwD